MQMFDMITTMVVCEKKTGEAEKWIDGNYSREFQQNTFGANEQCEGTTYTRQYLP